MATAGSLEAWHAGESGKPIYGCRQRFNGAPHSNVCSVPVGCGGDDLDVNHFVDVVDGFNVSVESLPCLC